MNLSEALAFIHCTDWKGSQLGLERMKELMIGLGNPHKQLKFVHVAGSNGKGSTAAMLASMMTAVGYQVGRYTSPHLLRVNERMNIGGRDISDEDLIAAAERVRAATEAMADQPTEFEIITAMALWYFADQACDIVVLEVGLGGRLDATNVIDAPEAAVITNIGLEHTEILGDTLEKIAAEKAGILKTGTIAVTYRETADVEAVYEDVCRRKHISLRRVAFELLTLRAQDLTGQTFDYGAWRELHVALLGEHQRRNAAVALETVLALREKGWCIPDSAVYDGLAATTWPARFEVLWKEPLFIVDGAHNPQCVTTLTENLAALLPDTPAVFLVGVLADKEYHSMFAQLTPFARAFVCLTPDSPRALPGEVLAAHLQDLGQHALVCRSVTEGIRTAMVAAGGGPVIACGSLYMMGDVREAFRPALKSWLRANKIFARDVMPASERAAGNHTISQRVAYSRVYQESSVILSYRAVRGEVDIAELNALAQAQGKTVAYPLCISKTEMIALRPRGPESWSVGSYGIPEPIPARSDLVAPESIDLVLCPCTAFDGACHRMGMGAGYYDRYLSKCVNAHIAAVAFHCQCVGALITEPWDRDMQTIFTEESEITNHLWKERG